MEKIKHFGSVDGLLKYTRKFRRSLPQFFTTKVLKSAKFGLWGPYLRRQQHIRYLKQTRRALYVGLWSFRIWYRSVHTDLTLAWAILPQTKRSEIICSVINDCEMLKVGTWVHCGVPEAGDCENLFPIMQYSTGYKTAADCSISLNFFTTFLWSRDNRFANTQGRTDKSQIHSVT